MTDTKQTIEEQILNVESVVESYAEHGDRLNAEAYGSILASLKELAAIKLQPVPVEPEMTRADDFLPTTYVVRRTDYDSLQSALQVAQQDKERLYQLNVDCEALIIRQREERKNVEERNKQLVELLREAQKWLCLQNDFNSQQCAKRIDAELLREAGK